MWCWRRMEKTIWIERVKKVLHRMKKDRKFLHTTKWSKAKLFGLFFAYEILLKHFLEGMTERKKGRGKRRKQLLDDLKRTRRYWNLKEAAVNRNLWRTCFGRAYGPVTKQSTWSWWWCLWRHNVFFKKKIDIQHAFTGTLLAAHYIKYVKKNIIFLFKLLVKIK
jgi:hypothetical protein